MYSRRIVLSALLPLAAAACGDSTSPNSATRDVTLRFRAAGATAGASASLASAPGAMFATASPSYTMAGDTMVVARGTDVLRITEVKFTIEDIDLERTAQTVDCSLDANAGNDDCSDHVDGPVLVRLALGGGASQFEVPAAVGTYDTVSFDISVPDGGDAHQEQYLAANPDMRGISARVIGTFNGQPFSFPLDLRGDREIGLVPHLVVTSSGTNFGVDLTFDVANWFNRVDGSLIDPNTVCAVGGASCATRDRIESNVEQSIQAYSND